MAVNPEFDETLVLNVVSIQIIYELDKLCLLQVGFKACCFKDFINFNFIAAFVIKIYSKFLIFDVQEVLELSLDKWMSQVVCKVLACKVLFFVVF